MTEEELPAEEPETWLAKLASIVPKLGVDDDVRDLDAMVEGVRVTPCNDVDLNERLSSGAYDVPPPGISRSVLA